MNDQSFTESDYQELEAALLRSESISHGRNEKFSNGIDKR